MADFYGSLITKNTYWIAVSTTDGRVAKQKVSGYTVTICGIPCGVRKNDDYWEVSELICGREVTFGGTRKYAIQKAYDVFTHKGGREGIEKLLKDRRLPTLNALPEYHLAGG